MFISAMQVAIARPPIQQQKRDPEGTRRTIGIVLLTIGMLLGGLLQLLIMVVPRLLSKHSDVELYAMLMGALVAIPLLLVYVWVPWIVDRYDPEPVWALCLAIAWGALGAGGFSLTINSLVHAIATGIGGKGFGEVMTACVCAPMTEEFTKAFFVWWMFFFMRRQFDGVVDGAVYGCFAALGFACFENILYYSRAVAGELLTNKEGLLAGQVIIRGILKPWGHPLYTAITGVGIGVARETNKTWLKWLAPIGCYCGAVFLHSCWNTGSMFVGILHYPLFFLFFIGFTVLVLFLVKRKGKIIKDHLRDEVLMGNLTPWELDLITSPVARIRATFSYGGAAGRRFVDAGARLALSKWHTGRATQGRKLTVSSDMILPLRQDLFKYRNEVSASLRRPVQQPQAWQAPPAAAPPQNIQTPYNWNQPRR